ncbi:hypothetical protein PHYSODRAFT_334859 [Phytophthora sojae]|uniref:Serine protease family S33 n=1 Tax=Phytophthora sojae (strain P6497) TaxID=1094619 RepID=G4ZSV0_PHYSP|nr:hypothetical protein PHYSODRAFT_334859 [Phytophthora sojae]EGZ13035.1 hypothetical protein PHYSODRAFT_334859 [Phytophthora sojae]|eukprot:XP_009530464.1 hypothetical protein PHYSODRAFT_334859 [Phytophthora sojae]
MQVLRVFAVGATCAFMLTVDAARAQKHPLNGAASDIASFISDYSNGAGTFVYGVSYGTVLVGRLMHLQPATVKGYIPDGIATSAGAPPGKFGKFFSKWEVEYGEFDNDRNSSCATLVGGGVTSTPPSYILRSTLGNFLANSDTQTLIPPLVYRLNRCDANDVKVLTQFFKFLESSPSSDVMDDLKFSSLQYYLTVFSEMWETPAPSQAQIEARFASMSITTGNSYDQTAGSKAATLPSDVSVLLLSGKLGPQTLHKYAEYLLAALQTSKKELVTFNYSTHDTVNSTPLNDTSDPGLTCGMKVLTSYISNSGDLQHLDMSCVNQMPSFNLTVPSNHLQDFFSTDEAYDGTFQVGLSAN